MYMANHALDEFVAKVKMTPVGTAIKAPWTNAFLGDAGQAAAVALIKAGAIGMAGADGRYRLYAGRDRAGNPFFRLLNGWFVYALVLAFCGALLWFARVGNGDNSGMVNVVGAALSVTGALYFGLHARHFWLYSRLLIGLGRAGDITRLGCCTLAAATGVAAAIGLALRIF